MAQHSFLQASAKENLHSFKSFLIIIGVITSCIKCDAFSDMSTSTYSPSTDFGLTPDVTVSLEGYAVEDDDDVSDEYYDSDSDDSDSSDETEEDDKENDINQDEENLNEEGGTVEPKILPFNLSESADDVRFLLFRDARNENKSEELILNNTKSVDQSGFNSKQRTVFIIHGFWSNSSSGMPVVIKRAYLEAGLPYNIIVVDWGKLSSPNPKESIFSPLSYPIIVTRNVPTVYNRVAEFIQFLVNENYTSLENIHLVGHSLGAHISGGAGHVIGNNPENEGHSLARISGLDPAGPLFQGIKVQRRLASKDAQFVDIYHTAAGTLGNVIYKEGDADFFPNGGHHQPGCVDYGQPIFFEAEFGSCSHSFVSKLYAASISKNFTACQCDPLFVDFIAGSACPGSCNVTVLAGEPCPPTASGQFYFETAEDPFADIDLDATDTTTPDHLSTTLKS